VLTSTDVNANVQSKSAQVTVVDSVKPVPKTRDIVIQLDAAGAASIVPEDIDFGSADACGIQSLAVSKSDFTCADVGENTVTLTVTDNNGNVDTLTAVVTVEDNVLPVPVTKPITVQLDSTGNTAITPQHINDGSSDACSISDLSIDISSFTCADVGGNTVTLSVTDVNDNVQTSSNTVTVEDNVKPVVITQDITVQLDAAGDVSITTADIDNGSSDACGMSLALDITAFTCAEVGANTVVLTSTDVNANVQSKSAQVTVVDSVKPVPKTRDIVIQLDAAGAASIVPEDIDFGSADACGIQSLAVSKSDFTCADVGENTVTLTVTDNNGNVDTLTAVVTVEDNVKPELSLRNITIELDSNGAVSIAASDIDVASSDACSIEARTLSQTSFDCQHVGDNTVEFTATDVNGNSKSETMYVTVQDNIAAVVRTSDIPLQLNAYGVSSITTDDIDAASSDACGIATYSLDKVDFDCSHVGQNTVVLTIVDVNGNVASNSATVQVYDTVQSETLTKDITVQLDSSGNVPLGPSDVDNGTNDACGVARLSVDIVSFSCGDVGDHVVTLTSVDVNGNANTASCVVTVEDNVEPAMHSQDITIELDSAGAASIEPSDVDNGSNDACSSPILSLNKTLFRCENVGSNTVLLTGEDVNQNTESIVAEVTVQDNIAPTMQSNPTVVTLDDDGDGSIEVSDIDAGTNDACSIAQRWLSQYGYTCAEVGDNTVTLFATDVNGNTASTTDTVTVIDVVQPHMITKNIDLQLLHDGTAAFVPENIDNGSSDSCGIESLLLDISSFACSNVGDNQVVLTAVDVNSNENSLGAVVTVIDSVVPDVYTRDITVQLDDAGTTGIVPEDIDNSSFDACGIALRELDISSFTCADHGSNTVNLTVTDVNSNANSHLASVNVEDNVAPFMRARDIVIQLNAAGTDTIVPSQIDAGTSDACGVDTVTLDWTNFNCADVGDNTVRLTATDVHFNVNATTATVTVQDSVVPSMYTKDITVQLDSNGETSIVPSDVDIGTGDACGIASTTLDVSSFTCADVGTQTVVFTATDVNGNANSKSSLVHVQDNVKPVPVTTSITVDLDSNGAYQIVPEDINNGSTDKCGIHSLVLDRTSFSCVNVGSNTVALTVTDVNSNAITKTDTVTVRDVMPPTVITKDITVELDSAGQANIVGEDVNNNSFDNCAVSSYSVSPNSFTCANVGTNAVVLTVTDIFGNSATESAVVTIVDNVDPNSNSKGATLYLDSQGAASIEAAEVNNNSSDACGVVAFSADPNTFTCADVGNNNVVLTVTDTNGNQDTSPLRVRVFDTIKPTVLVEDITIQLDTAGITSIVPNDVDIGTNDNCPIQSRVLNQTSFDCGHVGINHLLFTATDVHGNVQTETLTVTVQDNTEPVVLVQDIVVALDSNGAASIVPADIDNGSNDACGIAEYTIDKQAFACANLGPNSVLLTTRDVNNNRNDNSAVVSIVDTTKPLVHTRPVTVQLSGIGAASISVDDIDNGSTDNCYVVDRQVDLDAFNYTHLGATGPGENTVTLSVTDQSGNVQTAEAIVTVEDRIKPYVYNCPDDAPIRVDASSTHKTDDGTRVSWVLPTYMDNATPLDDIKVVHSHMPNDLFEIGSTIVRQTFTDSSQNEAECVVEVIVTDNMKPFVNNDTCPLSVTVNAEGKHTQKLGTIVRWNSPVTERDNVDGVITGTSVHASGQRFPMGDTVVTFRFTDDNLNWDECQFTVTIVDVTPPYVSRNQHCPANIALDAADYHFTRDGTHAYWAIPPRPADNVDEQVVSVSDFESGHLFPIGTTTVTFTHTDYSGNVATCEFTVAIGDVTPAIVAGCPSDFSRPASSIHIRTDTFVFWPEPIATDNVDGVLSAISVPFRSNKDPFPMGDSQVSYTWTDSAGNVITCVFTVSIVDTLAPVIESCPSDIVQIADEHHLDRLPVPGTEITWSAPFSVDNVDGIVFADATSDSSALSVPTPGSVFGLGKTTVSYEFLDNAGNTARCIFSATVFPAPARLTSVELVSPPYRFEQSFFASQFSGYSATVPYETDSMAFVGVLENKLASRFEINGVPAVSDEPSSQFDLTEGSNYFTSNVYARDRITNNTYFTEVIRSLSTNADIVALDSEAGTWVEPFDASVDMSEVWLKFTEAYTTLSFELDHHVSSIVSVHVRNANNDWVSLEYSELATGLNSIGYPARRFRTGAVMIEPNTTTEVSIETRAQDAVHSRVYVCTVHRSPDSPVELRSFGAVTENVTTSEEFSPDTTEYDVAVPYETKTVVFAPQLADENSTVEFNGTTYSVSDEMSFAVPLEVGNHTIEFTVTAWDRSASRTYALHIERKPSTNSWLSSVDVSGLVLSPAFEPGVFDYVITVDRTVEVVGELSALSVHPETQISVESSIAADGHSFVEIANMLVPVGETDVVIHTTAQDGKHKSTYTLLLNRQAASSVALLDNLLLSSGNTIMSPDFVSSFNGPYETEYAFDVRSVEVYVSTKSIGSTVHVEPASSSSNLPDAILLSSSEVPVAFKYGYRLTVDQNQHNLYNILVTSESGEVTQTYQVSSFVRPSPESSLDSISIESDGADDLEPSFNSSFTGPYESSVQHDIDSIDFLVKQSVDTSTTYVEQTGTGFPSASTSAPRQSQPRRTTLVGGVPASFDLIVGYNEFVLTSVAEDGATETKYRFSIVRYAPPCHPYEACGGNGDCIGLPPMDTCVCYSGYSGQYCADLEGTVATVVGAGTSAAVASGAAASVGGGGAGGATYGLLPFMFYLQQFVVSVGHNNELRELAKPFEAINYLQLNTAETTPENSHEGSWFNYGHGIGRKLLVVASVAMFALLLPGRVLTMCCFEVEIKISHFLMIFYLLLSPVVESLCDVPEQSGIIIMGICAAVIMALWSFVYFVVKPELDDDVRLFLPRGEGWKGLRPAPGRHCCGWGHDEIDKHADDPLWQVASRLRRSRADEEQKKHVQASLAMSFCEKLKRNLRTNLANRDCSCTNMGVYWRCWLYKNTESARRAEAHRVATVAEHNAWKDEQRRSRVIQSGLESSRRRQNEMSVSGSECDMNMPQDDLKRTQDKITTNYLTPVGELEPENSVIGVSGNVGESAQEVGIDVVDSKLVAVAQKYSRSNKVTTTVTGGNLSDISDDEDDANLHWLHSRSSRTLTGGNTLQSTESGQLNVAAPPLASAGNGQLRLSDTRNHLVHTSPERAGAYIGEVDPWLAFRFKTFFTRSVIYEPMDARTSAVASDLDRFVHNLRMNLAHYATFIEATFAIIAIGLSITFEGTLQFATLIGCSFTYMLVLAILYPFRNGAMLQSLLTSVIISLQMAFFIALLLNRAQVHFMTAIMVLTMLIIPLRLLVFRWFNSIDLSQARMHLARQLIHKNGRTKFNGGIYMDGTLKHGESGTKKTAHDDDSSSSDSDADADAGDGEAATTTQHSGSNRNGMVDGESMHELESISGSVSGRPTLQSRPSAADLFAEAKAQGVSSNGTISGAAGVVVHLETRTNSTLERQGSSRSLALQLAAEDSSDDEHSTLSTTGGTAASAAYIDIASREPSQYGESIHEDDFEWRRAAVDENVPAFTSQEVGQMIEQDGNRNADFYDVGGNDNYSSTSVQQQQQNHHQLQYNSTSPFHRNDEDLYYESDEGEGDQSQNESDYNRPTAAGTVTAAATTAATATATSTRSTQRKPVSNSAAEETQLMSFYKQLSNRSLNTSPGPSPRSDPGPETTQSGTMISASAGSPGPSPRSGQMSSRERRLAASRARTASRAVSTPHLQDDSKAAGIIAAAASAAAAAPISGPSSNNHANRGSLFAARLMALQEEPQSSESAAAAASASVTVVSGSSTRLTASSGSNTQSGAATVSPRSKRDLQMQRMQRARSARFLRQGTTLSRVMQNKHNNNNK
jgi:Cadherin-like beta sandwich domain/HYR domain